MADEMNLISVLQSSIEMRPITRISLKEKSKESVLDKGSNLKKVQLFITRNGGLHVPREALRVLHLVNFCI